FKLLIPKQKCPPLFSNHLITELNKDRAREGFAPLYLSHRLSRKARDWLLGNAHLFTGGLASFKKTCTSNGAFGVRYLNHTKGRLDSKARPYLIINSAN